MNTDHVRPHAGRGGPVEAQIRSASSFDSAHLDRPLSGSAS
ncbi:hypothetical protein FTUN_2498 [Frigoriglobus tundricola]|uniref:Uncharacterized protein n=1 Tax=Frigoriglobus tundricola TaxID=2774151 RepID=A0A6M5YPS7_9BACT|nr:hypothetical protein FTUN_2498 [Frigoriglobus tundricola]